MKILLTEPVLEGLLRSLGGIEVKSVLCQNQIGTWLRLEKFDAVVSGAGGFEESGLRALEKHRVDARTEPFILLAWPEDASKVGQLGGHYVPRNDIQRLAEVIREIQKKIPGEQSPRV